MAETQDNPTPTTAADQQAFNDELRGAMFRNNKGDNPNRPDYRGRCTIEGKQYRISAWKLTAKASGQPYLSLSFTAEAAEDTPKEDIGF